MLKCKGKFETGLAAFESRVAGVGPQVGYIFPISEQYQGYPEIQDQVLQLHLDSGFAPSARPGMTGRE
jgi:hypothetical protein